MTGIDFNVLSFILSSLCLSLNSQINDINSTNSFGKFGTGYQVVHFDCKSRTKMPILKNGENVSHKKCIITDNC